MKKESVVSILYSSIVIAAGVLLFPVHTIFAAEESSITGHPQYDTILNQYKEGIDAGWDMQTFSDHNLCYLAAYDLDLNHIGYYVADLDQNGTEELVIGKANSKEYLGFFYDLYTLKDNNAVLVQTSGERNQFYLCNNNIIHQLWSGSAFLSGWAYYNLNGSTIELREAVTYDSQYNETAPWFYSTVNISEDYSEPITEEECNSIKSQYVLMDIPYITLEEAFSETASSPETTPEHLKNTETKAAEIEQKLQEATSQSDMNQLSASLYQVWDDELNLIWSELKKSLDSGSMNTLTEEQLDWISEKESAMESASSQYSGGSLASMEYYLTGASFTEERVYEIAKYLPQ